jgi:general secretion pathway protein D
MYRLTTLRRVAITAVFSVLVASTPLGARTRKADRLLAEARVAEGKQDWDKALILAGQAIALDAADPGYMLEVRRVRFEAATYHVTRGQQLRGAGKLTDALAEFQKAYDIDPSSDIADQELRRTKLMIDREKKRAIDPNAADLDPDGSLTPSQESRKRVQDKVDSLMSVPELKPLSTDPIQLRMSNSKPKVLFETVGKIAGINVLFDPEYENAGAGKTQSIDLNGTTLNEALDYLAVVTHSFWKPMSPNTIFVTQENPTKRREYEDQVVKVFYLSNITAPQELQEVITTLRQVVEVTKLFNYSTQNAIIVKAEPARMALVEKIIGDLDKPRPEVLVDVVVMEVDSTHTRNLTAAFAPTGINTSVLFTPRSSLQTLASSLGTTSSGGTFTNNGTSSTSTGTTSSTGTTNTNTGTTSSTSSSSTTALPIPITNLGQINGHDFSISNVPGGLLEAVMTDSGTRILQRPSLRAVNNQKATLKIGEKIPTASGSFQAGVGAVGTNSLVNTQFTYIDTGVNLEITPFVHDNGEVSLHLDIDISQVDSYADLGGLSQPVIGQHKLTLDVRMRDGQINMIGGLIQFTTTKNTNGIPGLGSIPLLGRLFSGEQLTDNKSELLITLIPHIVRSADITAENLQEVYAGNATNYQVRYAQAPSTGDQTPGAPSSPAAGTTPVNPAVSPAVPPSVNPGVTPLQRPGMRPPAPPTGPAPRISFSPSQMQAQQGSTFVVTVRADGVTNLQSIESQIKFDPKVLHVNSITAGDLLQQNGLTLTPQRNILNDSGDASATLTRDSAKGGVSGSGGLLTITFQAVGAGQTLVTMPKTVLRDGSGAEMTAGTAPLSVTVK